MIRALILGGSGMLGSMVVDWLARDPAIKIGATVRNKGYLEHCGRLFPEVQWHLLDIEDGLSCQGVSWIENYDWIVNAIGVIKPFIKDGSAPDIQRAIQINALFPYLLAREAESTGRRVIQIATDCVYSGKEGRYSEDAPHHPDDVYGKTKSLGEVSSKQVFHLRCSIIGPEVKNQVSLLEWFLKQPLGSTVTGFTNHRWNGITTLQFAKICHGIIKRNLKMPSLHHIVPEDDVTKAELLADLASGYVRGDIIVNYGTSQNSVDRTLATKNPALNRLLWESAGYINPQSIQDMIKELCAFESRFVSLDPAT